jgi:hypothetical protein
MLSRPPLPKSTGRWTSHHFASAFFIHFITAIRCGRRHDFPQSENPLGVQVVGQLEHLRIIAPELLPRAVGEADGLKCELFINARPFPELSAIESFRNSRMSEARHQILPLALSRDE